jgi:CDP-diacylglycerol---glycerol-3-phosphate 3-phosphatidyltransferase
LFSFGEPGRQQRGKAIIVVVEVSPRIDRSAGAGKPHPRGGELTGSRMNLPNSITMSRIVMIPLLLWMLSPHFPWRGPEGTQELAASVLFILASITDGLDGYLARKRGQITTMGMLLDPLADKIMITAALIALVAYNPEIVKVWIAVVIIGREFLISGLRSIAASEGFTITASELGKLKTVIQIVAVVSAILAHRWDQWQVGVLVIPVKWYAIAAIYFAVLVSIISAVDYFVGFWKKIDVASKDRRKVAVLSRGKSTSII